MNDLINYNQHAYISTRESAKRLNVSLGTIQKMVEMGELTAWKTRGGHRRVLVQSIDDHLKNRHLSYRNQLIRERILFGIFKRTDNILYFEKLLESFKNPVQFASSIDVCEALMRIVELKPHAIFIDCLLPPTEQLHFIHYLSKNEVTQKIPILIDEGFTELHPGVLRLAGENAGIIQTFPRREAAPINPDETFKHPYIFGYPGSSSDSTPLIQGQDLEEIIQEALMKSPAE
ncbi:MAG: excisionase family DNA-binding protein [Polynucleobacter sp.]|jgi:excisionase family DNA binding protein|nr:excisionase family DNA-binding protein [Polynucleobacter sp.]